jgi:hypothetical protein
MAALSRGLEFAARTQLLIIYRHWLTSIGTSLRLHMGVGVKKILASATEKAFISDADGHALTIKVFEKWNSIFPRNSQ